MAELVARDTLSSQRWRRRLVPYQPFIVGRATSTFPVFWDKQVSSKHAQLTWNGVQLEIRKFEEAINPIFYEERPRISFMMDPGQHFVIGHTEFLLETSEPTMPQPHRSPKTEVTIRPEEIRKAAFRKVPGRIELLTELVSRLTSSSDYEQLITITLQQLLQGIPHATDVLLLEQQSVDNIPQFVPVAWDSRDGVSTPQGASRSLIEHASRTQLCVIHVWPEGPDLKQGDFTQIVGHDWAMCIPLQVKFHQTAALYISGRRAVLDGNFTEVEVLQDDIKYAELVGSTFANLSRNLALERRQSQLNQFFSPGLLERVPIDLEQYLTPREADLTVLFCDLRGFSAAAEEHFDRLIPYLRQTSETLSHITAAILAQQGVIGDFHGDAVMGFWGWPNPAVQNPLGAIHAAWEIVQQLADVDLLCGPTPPQAGIGIAAGRGVAGMIGSRDQVKVTAFGPPVNLAARVEGLTKPLRVPLLLDEQAVLRLQAHPAMRPGTFLRLGNFRMAGLRNPTQVFTFNTGNADWTTRYAQALHGFELGNWRQAAQLLEQVPVEFGPREFLWQWMTERDFQCPGNWDGTIERQSK